MASKAELDMLKKYCEGKGLNIGCGRRPIKGAINVDIDPKALADVYAPANMLPFYPETMDYIVSSHCLEHVDAAPLIIFREWLRVLKVGGTLAFIVPDGNVGDVALGESPGKFVEGKHVNMFTAWSLESLLSYTGADVVNIETITRPEWSGKTILAVARKTKRTGVEIPNDSFRAYLLWLGAVRKTVTLHGLMKWMTKRW